MVINGTEAYLPPARGEWKKTLHICRCASVLANQPEHHRQCQQANQPEYHRQCQQITSRCQLRSRNQLRVPE